MFNKNDKKNKINNSLSLFSQILDIAIPNVIAMVVQAAPNTHPGGVHGAFRMLLYQSDVTPSFVHNPPIAKPIKFSIMNIKDDFKCFFISISIITK